MEDKENDRHVACVSHRNQYAYLLKGFVMSDVLEIYERGEDLHVAPRVVNHSSSWKDALLAGLPHVLMGIFEALVLIISVYVSASPGKNLANVIGISFVVIF
jgi:hypothetical protein